METPLRPITLNRNPCTVGLKTVFKAINNRSPEGREARKFFEGIKTSIQCKDVVGQKTNCWICGGAFVLGNVWYSPQCEHILPVAQGVIFLDLYTKRTQDPTTAMKLEYDWAHAICNNIKNNTVLIKGDESNFDPDVDKIVELLNSLKSKGIPISSIEDQVAHIQSRLLTITDYIDQLPNYEINLPGASCPIPIKFGTSRKTFKRKSNGLSRRINKHLNRKTAVSYRKRRTSNRGRAKTST